MNDFDAVLYTHDHADHSHGIDDLRQIVRMRGRPMDIFGDRKTLKSLKSRFAYAFSTKGPHHQPFLIPHELENPTRIGDIDVLTFEHLHGSGTTLGFRFGDLAYSTDCMELSESAFSALNGVKLWIVDALVRDPHPTHAHLDLTLSWIERVRPRRAIITHMAGELDYATLLSELPEGVVPAYDGMIVELSNMR
tara:strand:+ start:980 stop:1558 length:579 start_codon:yes stop_codon:yes gene_type:complete